MRVRVGEMAQGRWAPPRISAVPFLLLLVSVLVPTTLLAQEGISLVGLTQLGPVETVAEFGQVEGGDGVAFSAVYDGRFIGDSSVAVADARRPVILVVDLPSGVAREIGRSGEGPGEFTGTPYLGLERAGRISAWDPGTGRMSWFSVEGELLDEATVNPSQMARLPNSRTPRAWQVADGLVLSATGRQRREAAAIVTTIRPVLVDPVRSSIEGVGPTMVASAPMDGGIYVQNPWKPFGVVTLRNGEMVVADTIDWRLSFHTPGTEVVRQLHAEVEQIPVNPELERQIDDTFEEYYGNNRTMVRLYEDMDPPDVLPAIGALRSSSDGQLLVTRFRPLEAGGPLVVDVLDPELRPSARLVLPAEYSQILDMIGDKVLVLTRGEFDVPVIRVLRVGAVSPER